MRKALAVLVMLVGAPIWAYGAWRFYEGTEGLGTLLVVVGGMTFIAGLSLYRRDPDIAVEGAWHAVFESLFTRR